MDIRKYKDNNAIYRQKFDDYEVELPSDDWEVFSCKLADAQPKRRRFVWYYVATAASVLGVLFLGVSYLENHNFQGVGSQLAKQSETSASARFTANAYSNSKVQNTKTNTQSHKQNLLMASSLPSKVDKEDNNKAREHDVIQNEPSQIADTKQNDAIQIKGQSVNQQISIVTNVPANNFDTTGYITHPVPQYAELPALPTDQLNQEDRSGDRKKTTGSNNLVKWVSGSFQGNLGLSSGSDGNLTSDGSIGSQLFTRVSQAELLSASSTPSLMSFSGKKTYYLPLSFGISVGIPLSKRWELQSGLVYTRLTTTGELGAQYSGGATSTGRIEQHYLGIPVSFAYSFIQKPSFAVYAIGGGRIEKGLSLVEKIYTYDSQNTPIEKEHYRYSINGVQLALDAGIGASYRLYRFLHWYVETGGAWYIPCNQPESSRTEHPLTLSLKTGVKFSLTR